MVSKKIIIVDLLNSFFLFLFACLYVCLCMHARRYTSKDSAFQWVMNEWEINLNCRGGKKVVYGTSVQIGRGSRLCLSPRPVQSAVLPAVAASGRGWSSPALRVACDCQQ